MTPQQLLFVFSRSSDDSLSWDAWDAAMTAGLLNQSVTILFSGNGLIQLENSAVIDKIESLADFFTLRLCAQGALPLSTRATKLEAVQVEEIPINHITTFTATFDHVLSF